MADCIDERGCWVIGLHGSSPVLKLCLPFVDIYRGAIIEFTTFKYTQLAIVFDQQPLATFQNAPTEFRYHAEPLIITNVSRILYDVHVKLIHHVIRLFWVAARLGWTKTITRSCRNRRNRARSIVSASSFRQIPRVHSNHVRLQSSSPRFHSWSVF